MNDYLIRMVRDDLTETHTFGHLFFDDGFQCLTLEDPVRPVKIMHTTAIPSGRYRVMITLSHRFKVLLPLLLDVENFSGIRIHAGNSTADTSGCILVGLTRSNDRVLQSRIALQSVQQRIADAEARGQSVWIEMQTATVTTTETYKR